MMAEAEGRKPRADGLRNRERLIDVAKLAFAEIGPNVSLEEIARRAEVGIGTLYRHFPTRDDIIAAVYRREVTQLADAAKRLLETRPAGEALHEWLRLFVDYIATKKVIAPAHVRHEHTDLIGNRLGIAMADIIRRHGTQGSPSQ